MASPCQLHHPVGVASRRADDVANLRVQAIRTDQHITLGRTAVVELDPHPVVGTDHSTARELNRIRSDGKPSSSRSSTTRRGTIRTGAPSRSTIAVRSKVTSGRPVDVKTRTLDSR